MSACRSCGADIRWTLTAEDKRMPVDSQADPAGNVAVTKLLDGSLASRIITAAAPLRDGELPFRPHWASCPNADAHRKRK